MENMEKEIYLLRNRHDEINLHIEQLQNELMRIENAIGDKFTYDKQVIARYYLDAEISVLNDFLKLDKVQLPDNLTLTDNTNVYILNHVKNYIKQLPLQNNVWHRVLEKFLLMVLPVWVVASVNINKQEFMLLSHFRKDNVQMFELTNLLQTYNRLLKSDNQLVLEYTKRMRQYFEYLPHFNYGCWQNNKIKELSYAIEFQSHIVKVFSDVLESKYRFEFGDYF